jgi:predicted regulator of Ras-like GTPase activity (Roadblock/LC7/MglB family)
LEWRKKLNKVLAEIKAVQGVSGVMILDLESRVTYRLLPAHVEKDRLNELATILLEVYPRMEEPTRIDLKFDNGIAIVARLNRAGILIYGRPSLNLPLLKLVLGSSISTIEQKLKRKTYKTAATGTDETSTTMTQGYVESLVEAMNEIASVYRKYIGAYSLGQKVREARERLLGEFPFLRNFFVDNNGVVVMIRGKQGLVEERVVCGFARWASVLKELCQKTSPEIRELQISQLTQNWADKLEEMGFYQLYED